MRLNKASSSTTRVQASKPRLAVLKAVRTTKESAVATGEEIYIGFPKGDYAPREGRKGRVIVDDPKRYPGREDLGPIPSVVGGWAGGEAGLQKFREQIQKEEAAKKEAAKPKTSKPSASGKPKAGESPIYVGFGKDELDVRKSGAPGRVIFDNPSKYPDKDTLTGGFAGGERGLRSFVETGEVRLRKPGEPGGQPISPLIIAFIVLLAGIAGAAVLTEVYDFGEGAVKTDKIQAFSKQLSEQLAGENAQRIELGTAALLGIVAVKLGADAVTNKLRENAEAIADNGRSIIVYAAYLGFVALATRAVLEI